MEINNNKEKRVIYSSLTILLIIGVFIAIAGYQYHKNFKKHFKANIENQLSIIADLKVSEIEHWLEERRGNADAMFKNEVFSNLIKRHLNNPNDSIIKREIQTWMKEIQIGFNYNAVILTDPHLIKKIIIPEEHERSQASISPGNIDSLNAGKIVFEDFYRNDSKQKIFLKLLVPILDLKKLIGIVEMRIDPKTYLYPMLENWPVVSETSETIILRREGNKAVYLNELKFQKKSALNFSVSLEQTNVPAVRAVLGQVGFMEGTGYSGKAVVAYINKIPNSPWYMISKTDASEAYAPLRKNLLFTVIFSFGIFIISGLSLGFLWRNQRTLIYKERIISDEALQKLNLAIYNSHDVVFLTDKEGTITYINPQFTNIYGYTAEEVVGVTTPRILDSGINKKEDLKSFWDILLNKQSIPATEYFNKCKDGKLIKIEGSANPIINNSGDIIGFLGMQRDITDRKKAEENLAAERSLLRALIDNIPDRIYAKDTNGRFTVCNKALIKRMGKSDLEEIIGKSDVDLLPYELASQYITDEQEIILTGLPLINHEETFRDLSGMQKWSLTTKVPLHDNHGKIIGIIGIGKDITDRKKAEEKLSESEIKLKVILQSTADGILAVDSNGKVIRTNNRFAEMWGIPKKLIDSGDDHAIISFVLEQLVNPDEFISKVNKLYNSTDEDLDHLYFKDGRTFERFSAPLVMDDSLIGRVWSFRDITKARQAEEEIKKSNEELSKANAEKDKFFSILAHDLRGPMSAFVGITELLREDFQKMTPDQVKDFTTSMNNDASNIYKLLENLLEWSRLKRGMIDFKPEKHNLKNIINKGIEVVSVSSQKKGIGIDISVTDNLDVIVDENMFETIVRNLVSNAVKFTPAGGKINVSAYVDQDKSIEIKISDNGIGMSPELKSKLFLLNENTGRKGTEGESSSGLGLLLCKEFVEKHNGKIWVESEEGKGSTFYFSLPSNS